MSASTGPSVSVSITGSGSHSAPDTGAPTTVVGSDSWVINPESSFPLTIRPANGEIARQIKALLDQGGDRLRLNESLRSLMLREGVRCKEIDDYVARFKPAYLATVETLKKATPEWSTASQLDRGDLLEEFRAKAVQMLEVSPAAICDVRTLFECEPDFGEVRNLFVRNGTEAIDLCNLYGRYSQNIRKVHHLPADDLYRRPDFEKLVEAGLAARGLQIPVSDILNSLTLKELRAVVADTSTPFFKRKAEAVEYAAGLRDITDRLAKVMAFRELFQLRPLPQKLSVVASELFSEPVLQTKRFAHEASCLIAHTYAMGAYDLRDRSDPALAKMALGWEISADDGSCPMCRKAAARLYPKGARPRAPLHIGCRCGVEAKL
ncbi:MAG: hypothetical protein WA005_12910 [Candidatus Binataceae bacterium]